MIHVSPLPTTVMGPVHSLLPLALYNAPRPEVTLGLFPVPLIDNVSPLEAMPAAASRNWAPLATLVPLERLPNAPVVEIWSTPWLTEVGPL